MFLMRGRLPTLEKLEQALVDYFASRVPSSFSKRVGEAIIGSLGIYTVLTSKGVYYHLAFDDGGTDSPIFLPGWRDSSLAEMEWGLEIARKGVELLMCPATIIVNPKLTNLPWTGWGTKQAKLYLDHFLLLGFLSGRKPPDVTGVG